MLHSVVGEVEPRLKPARKKWSSPILDKMVREGQLKAFFYQHAEVRDARSGDAMVFRATCKYPYTSDDYGQGSSKLRFDFFEAEGPRERKRGEDRPERLVAIARGFVHYEVRTSEISLRRLFVLAQWLGPAPRSKLDRFSNPRHPTWNVGHNSWTEKCVPDRNAFCRGPRANQGNMPYYDLVEVRSIKRHLYMGKDWTAERWEGLWMEAIVAH